MPCRMIQVGAGGWGGAWCAEFLPPNVADGTVEVVALVDTDPDAFGAARERLHLPAGKCYTDLDRALDENPADFCAVVVPPSDHEAVVDAALARGLHILSEKPIADTLAGSIRIAGKVAAAGVKMAVTMSHRFRQDITTLRTRVQSGDYGPLDYVVSRYLSDRRKFPTWGEFRYRIPGPLMIEGAVHHLDLLVDLAGGCCETLYAQTWDTDWSDFAGDSQALVTMRTASGARVSYEGANSNAAGLNDWGAEYIRAECRDATLVMSHGRIERFDFDPTRRQPSRSEGTGEPVTLIEQPKWANTWLIEKFVRSLDGGETMETDVESNLQSVALIFAAIESSRADRPVAVQEFLQEAREDA